MMRFTTDQLHTFVTVIEYGTFDATADLLGISASAVSQRIKAMEQLAGRVLLKRTNPVAPTESGQSVLRIARQSEFLHGEMERELGGGGAIQSVAVAVNADSLATWFLTAVGELAAQDKIFCDVRREGEFHSSALLRSGEVMAALTSRPESIPGCSVEKLGEMRYHVVASGQYVRTYFPHYPQVTADELALAPVVEFDRKDFGLSSARDLLAQRFSVELSALGVPPRIYIPSSPDYARAVLAGIAWGIVPEAQCLDALESDDLVELTEEPIDVPLYWQHWNISSPVLQRLSEKVYNAAQRGGGLR